MSELSQVSPVSGRVGASSSRRPLRRLTDSVPRFRNPELWKTIRAEEAARDAANLESESSKRFTELIKTQRALEQITDPDIEFPPPPTNTLLQLPQPVRLPPPYTLARVAVPFSNRLSTPAVSNRQRSVRLPPQVVSDRLRSVRLLGSLGSLDELSAGGKGSRRRYNNYKKTRKGRVNNRRRKSKRGKTLRRH
uniref:Uncharacterized protein n=1 Tax=viral metagenome TaxID=1070528 RepID=A0A6C0DXG1_9ZZZZ